MTVEEVKQTIANSKLDPALKQRLVSVLPSLDKYSLGRLGAEVSHGDVWIIGGYLTSLWERFATILNGLKKADPAGMSEFSKLLTEMERRPNLDDRLYTLSLVLDVRELTHSGAVHLADEQYMHLLEYEASLFWYLPKQEIIFLLRNSLLFLLPRRDVARDVQVATYDHGWDYAGNFEKIFTDALLQNSEVLGSSTIRKTVGAWIQEFIKSDPAPLSERSIINVTNFLAANPSANKLNSGEKNSLGETLKLFLWFLHGTIDEKEIRDYKERVQAEGGEELDVPSQQTSPSAGTAPRPLNIQDILMNKQGKGGGIRSTPQDQPAKNQVRPVASAPSPVPRPVSSAVQPNSQPNAPRSAPPTIPAPLPRHNVPKSVVPPPASSTAPPPAAQAARPTVSTPPKPPASAVQDEIVKKLAELKNRSSQNNSQKK